MTFGKVHAVAHPENARTDVENKDVAKGACSVLEDMVLDITEYKNKFNKASIDGDLNEFWWESMNRVFHPVEDFLQGRMLRYRIFHCPESARLAEFGAFLLYLREDSTKSAG
jgi:hypothetical protein